MQKIVPLALAFALAAGPAAAESPFYGLFDYHKPEPPVGGDCSRIAAAVGPEATWYGEVAGKHYDVVTDNYSPYGAQGCFTSEGACYVWSQRAITYLDGGPMLYARCTQGVSRR